MNNYINKIHDVFIRFDNEELETDEQVINEIRGIISEALKEPQKEEGKWISKKEPPKKEDYYLVCVIDYPQFVAKYHEREIDGSHWIYEGYAVFPDVWQPLPSPPTK